MLEKVKADARLKVVEGARGLLDGTARVDDNTTRVVLAVSDTVTWVVWVNENVTSLLDCEFCTRIHYSRSGRQGRKMAHLTNGGSYWILSGWGQRLRCRSHRLCWSYGQWYTRGWSRNGWSKGARSRYWDCISARIGGGRGYCDCSAFPISECLSPTLKEANPMNFRGAPTLFLRTQLLQNLSVKCNGGGKIIKLH